MAMKKTVSNESCNHGGCASATPVRKTVKVEPELKTKNLARLKRIEGQVRGIGRMVEEDKYCIDVLTQISASMSSLRAVGLLVLQDHIRGCVIEGDPENREETLEELNRAIERFVRSVGG